MIMPSAKQRKIENQHLELLSYFKDEITWEVLKMSENCVNDCKKYIITLKANIKQVLIYF